MQCRRYARQIPGKWTALFVPDLPCLIGHIVQIAIRIWVVQIDGRRNYALMQCQHRYDCFHRACRTKHMAGHGLGGTDQNLRRFFSQRRFNRLRFRFIIQRRPGSMGVDINLPLGPAGFFQRQQNRPSRPFSAWCRRRHMICVAGTAVSCYFGINVCAAPFGVLVFF